MFSRVKFKLNFAKGSRHRREKHTKADEQPDSPPDRVVSIAAVDVSTPDAESSTPARANLWEVAGGKLDEKDRLALGLESSLPITNAIENVIQITEEKYREYKEGGLKIRKRNGGHINVRDAAKNIILHALQAQDFVSKLVSYDVTSHASIAWSVVSLGLTMIKNDIERRDDIFHAAEYLTGILSYYAILENHYRDRKVESDRGLEDALVEVYTAILQYTAEVKKAENESKAARVGESIRALVQESLKELKETVEKKEQAVLRWADLTVALDHRKQAESMLDGIDEAIERLKAIQSHTRSLQDREILDWLSAASYSDPQNTTQNRRASNTGKWFLNMPKYEKWKFTPGKILWLYGAVGCGKSVLCSTVIQDIEEFCESDTSRNYAYWYFQFSNDETQKMYNMIRSILRQFMPPILPGSIIKLWEEHCHRGSKPQQRKLAEILDNLLETSQGEFFLILDALDECPATGDNERSSLLQFLEELLKKHQTKLHILATSRPEPDIRSRLEQYQRVDLEAGLSGDVETFVRAQVAHGRLCEWGESLKKRTLERLLDIPERRFRWADLQIKRLEKSKTEEAFQKALDSIPVTLEDTYKDTLERISPDDREAARTILIWLSFSAVPLDLKTIAAVVSFRFPEDVVTTCTTSLVTVSISDDTVRLAHFSVKEFLVRNEAGGHWYQFSAISGHNAIATRTIDCLLETTEILSQTTASRQPLLIYAARYWGRHLAEVEELYATDTGLQKKVDRLFTERDVYFNWVRLVDVEFKFVWRKSFEEVQSPLYSASRRGLKPTVEMLLAQGANPMGSGLEVRNNALLAAARGGHLEILELLLGKVDEIPRGVTERMLNFIYATESDKEKLTMILDLLWDKGALHDQSRASLKIIDGRLAERAAKNGSSAHIVMSCLLDRKEKMGLKITKGLLRAVLENLHCGNKTMHLLLEKCDADIRLTPSLVQQGMSILNIGAMIAILNKQVKNDIKLDEEWTEAFARGKKETMELLLQEHGEEIRVTQKVLISAANSACDPQTVKLLLARREPGSIIDKEIFLAAAGNGSHGSEIMDVLLEECGQDIIIDEEIIQRIVQNHKQGVAMIKTLLCRQQAGFVVTEQILCDAARYHDQEMLELLVNNTGGSGLPITEETLRSVADNHWRGRSLIRYLYDLLGHTLPVSEDALLSVADIGSPTADYVLAFILERWPDIPVTDRLLEAACTLPNSMSLLLDRRCDFLPIKRMIQKIATDGDRGSGRVLGKLLDRRLVGVDEWLMETVTSNSHTLRVIHKRDPDFPVTPNLITKIVQDRGAMDFLLDRQNNQVLITEEVVKSSLLGRHPRSVIRLLLSRLGSEAVPITEDILIYAIQNNNIYQATHNIKALELFLEQRRDLNLNAVWEAIWQDPEIDPVSLAQAAGALLRYVSFEVSAQMLEMLPSLPRQDCVSYRPFDEFIRACMQHRIPLPTTEAAVELIVERASFDTVEIFFENYPGVPVTDKHIEAAKRNPREDVDKDEMVSLLMSTRKSYSKEHK
ncbi:hypothetical protein ASPFODRAFT_44747 [Aspergillus luchuensis CBS 106.47]|uniref:Uncharacterized protein n=1 Tax=Aspergillus luchuensis (strain CBS 106.47) TaxID=1137211 RepID=A0A1M3TK29_ASPLC|nr:hypothetical protein ASPFODRAFT_44747 [Aspergillus luchuensis CBS 106.47]